MWKFFYTAFEVFYVLLALLVVIAPLWVICHFLGKYW